MPKRSATSRWVRVAIWLRVLTSDSLVRADVIRQYHERDEGAMVDVLSELEADDLLRHQVVEELRRSLA